MLPENIDDLFRNKLDGHETPPGDALWTRLQALPPDAAPPTDGPAERLDQLFQQGLNAHATPPGRALWERLEDEHLRPRKRRALAWWPMALVAAVALLLVAGGAGLWLGLPWSNPAADNVASQLPKRPNLNAATSAPPNGATVAPAPTNASATAVAPVSGRANNAIALAATAPSANIQKNATARATRPSALASTTPEASSLATGPTPRHMKGTTRQPDAATDHLPLVARAAAPGPHRTTPPTTADERRPGAPNALAVAAAPNPVPALEIVLAAPAPAPAPASTMAVAAELITVDVRNGANPAARPAQTTSSAAASAESSAERRPLGSRLLRQAGHLVRGERMSLAEVTGLPENVTLRATVAGRSLTRSFQL